MTNNPILTKSNLNKVYDILVNLGGANESERNSFIYNHYDDKYICTEWRFGGKLGFGGKYRSNTNTVDCYSEDMTIERENIINQINLKLKTI